MLEDKEKITNLMRYLKTMKDKPVWNDCEKRILAWAISTDGSVGLGLRAGSPRIKVEFSNTEEDIVKEFFKIAHFGSFSKRRPSNKLITRAEWFWNWQISSTLEVYYLLQQITSFFPSQRKQRIANLIIEFAESRINRGAKRLQRLPLSQREKQIIEEVTEINRTKKSRRLSTDAQKPSIF